MKEAGRQLEKWSIPISDDVKAMSSELQRLCLCFRDSSLDGERLYYDRIAVIVIKVSIYYQLTIIDQYSNKKDEVFQALEKLKLFLNYEKTLALRDSRGIDKKWA